MFGFMLKKTFFDLWDNLFKAALVNIGFMLSLAWPLVLPFLFESVPVLFWAALVSGVIWCFAYLSAASWSLKAVSDYGNFGFGDFAAALKSAAVDGIIPGCLALLLVLSGLYGIPFYLTMDSKLGVVPAALIFWTLVVMLLALQFYFPVRNRLGRQPLKILKKCFLIFLDNPGFSVAVFISGFLLSCLSLVLLLLFPGPAGLLLLHDEALRLRLLKYDWMEEHPGQDRKIPWDALLIEEREKTGTRSLKNFIFPWKD
ncbi:MAG: hypothetical protein LBK40_08490 [Spirochaetaceae bacterium]|nr:hypothetical protein [Spirochaetaceae bacterium]